MTDTKSAGDGGEVKRYVWANRGMREVGTFDPENESPSGCWVHEKSIEDLERERDEALSAAASQHRMRQDDIAARIEAEAEVCRLTEELVAATSLTESGLNAAAERAEAAEAQLAEASEKLGRMTVQRDEARAKVAELERENESMREGRLSDPLLAATLRPLHAKLARAERLAESSERHLRNAKECFCYACEPDICSRCELESSLDDFRSSEPQPAAEDCPRHAWCPEGPEDQIPEVLVCQHCGATKPAAESEPFDPVERARQRGRDRASVPEPHPDTVRLDWLLTNSGRFDRYPHTQELRLRWYAGGDAAKDRVLWFKIDQDRREAIDAAREAEGDG